MALGFISEKGFWLKKGAWGFRWGTNPDSTLVCKTSHQDSNYRKAGMGATYSKLVAKSARAKQSIRGPLWDGTNTSDLGTKRSNEPHTWGKKCVLRGRE